MTTDTRAAVCGSEVLNVDFPSRTITVIAAPYNQVALVPYRGGVWRETIAPSAFDDISIKPSAIRVNREHDRAATVGKVVRFNPRDPRGLIAEIRVARTTRGDETLALADENCLSASVAFWVHAGGELLDHRAKTRRIIHGGIDHVSLVESPAYSGASVLAVRATPNIDAYERDPVFTWARWQCDPVVRWARDWLARR